MGWGVVVFLVVLAALVGVQVCGARIVNHGPRRRPKARIPVQLEPKPPTLRLVGADRVKLARMRKVS